MNGPGLVQEGVSVLVCSRGRPDMLAETVASVLNGDSLPAEIVVIDQSLDPHPDLATMENVRGCAIRYVHSATRGLSRARNIGLRTAANDTVVLLDDDMFVARDWLRSLVSKVPAERVVFTGRVLAAPREGRGDAVPPAALVERSEPAIYRGPQPLDVVPGANVALPRSLVLELGGYDERMGAGTRFPAAEDNDMGYRLLSAGCEVQHVPEAVVFHRAWRTRRERARLKWTYGRGKGAFYAKHAHIGDPYALRRARADSFRRLRRFVELVGRSPRNAVAELISFAATIAGALDWTITVRLPDWLRGHERH